MEFNQEMFNNSSIQDFSTPCNSLFNSYDEKSEYNDYPYNSHSQVDNFNFPNFNEMNEMNWIERPTNNVTNEGRNNNEIPEKKKSKIFNIHAKKLLGRKKKIDTSKHEHDRFADDNLRRKVKHIVIKSVTDFINEKIKYVYNGNIGHNMLKKQFLISNKKQKSDATIDANKAFLNKSIGDILSVKISKKYTNYEEDHNKKLVEFLKSENNLDTEFNFSRFFDLTFLQCLKHYRGTEFYDELNGIICFDEDKKKIKDEDNYIPVLENYAKNYENILEKKKSRLKNNKKENVKKKINI